MEELVAIVLGSGKTAVELALYILLPIMVVMMALMKLLEAKGALGFVAKLLSPVLAVFGVPGIGVFAILQLVLVSFAAPVATLSIMDHDGTPKRRLAATLAMILTMSQANVVFPMIAVGLNLWPIFMTSLVGGFVASSLTFYVLTRGLDDEPEAAPTADPGSAGRREEGAMKLLLRGGEEGVQIVFKSIPVLVLAIFCVDILREVEAIAFLEWLLSPLLGTVGLPGIAVLSIATKYLAGGTAMMGVTVDLVREGALSAIELNRLAGFLINPLDFVGIAVLASAGPRVASIVRPAVLGAIVGIAVRGALHLIFF